MSPCVRFEKIGGRVTRRLSMDLVAVTPIEAPFRKVVVIELVFVLVTCMSKFLKTSPTLVRFWVMSFWLYSTSSSWFSLSRTCIIVGIFYIWIFNIKIIYISKILYGIHVFIITSATVAFGIPNANAEYWVAVELITGCVRACTMNWVSFISVEISVYSPHPLNVYVLPSIVVTWGSPRVHPRVLVMFVIIIIMLLLNINS